MDAVSIEELVPWLRENRDSLVVSLLEGSYQPQNVRGEEIPKPRGGHANSEFRPWWTALFSKLPQVRSAW
jgi:hypothetical protein